MMRFALSLCFCITLMASDADAQLFQGRYNNAPSQQVCTGPNCQSCQSCPNGQCTAPQAVKAAPIALGDTVIYTVPDGKYAGEKRVATIVWLSDNGRANLSVQKAHLRPGETADTEQPTIFAEDVRYCPEGTKGTFALRNAPVSAVASQNCPCVQQNGSCPCVQQSSCGAMQGQCGNCNGGGWFPGKKAGKVVKGAGRLLLRR